MMDDRSAAIAASVERHAYRQRLDVFLASRDAARGLMADALEEAPSLAGAVDAASTVADYADEAIAIVTEEYRPKLECSAGCSYCCRKPGVLVTVPELLRIAVHLRDAFAAGALDAVRARARDYVERLDGRSFDEPTDESFPCPLLDDDRCSVYALRPLTCRGYNSTSSSACEQAHASGGATVPLFALIKDASDGATVGTATALRDAGLNDALVDLGTALDVLLRRDLVDVERIAGDAEVLAPAINATWVRQMWVQVREAARQIGVKVRP